MKLTPIAANQIEVELSSGVTVFFSYKTPAHVPGKGYLRTDQHYSRTTTRHINQWIGGDSTVVTQSYIEALV